MKITVFNGTTRDNAEGHKVAHWVMHELKAAGHQVHLIDPDKVPEMQVFRRPFRYMENPSEQFKEAAEWVKSSDGYVAITPEYNHSYSGALKNAIDCFLPEYRFRVFALVTYSTGALGGVRAAEHLRGVCAELGAPAIPISLQISHVDKALGEGGKLQDEAYKKRFARMLGEFTWYMEAMHEQRKKKLPE